MSVYQEILSWSQNRPLFIQDALRRIVTSSSITQNDIDELLLLLKKECGDISISLNPTPLDYTHIPTTSSSNGNYPKLIGLKNPINICALHNQGNLQFACDKLTVIYGNNGSGKSSYSRILSKLCWSRNPTVELKRNVFTPSNTQQQVEIIIGGTESNINFTWTENSPTHPSLNQIFVFDKDCADIYINRENPTEYKPIGIDVLEKLIVILKELTRNLNIEIVPLNTQKPIIDHILNSTVTAIWFSNIEKLERDQVDLFIQFSESDINRKRELTELTSSQNPQQNIEVLRGRKTRLDNHIQQLVAVENLFSENYTTDIITLRENFESVNQAYQIAVKELNNLNTIEGFGNSPWRALWNAAKNFAHNSNMSDGENFPSSTSLDKCVLCQQELDESARQRMISFNEFVLNDISTQLNSIQDQINSKINIYNSISIPTIDSLSELEDLMPEFRNRYNEFSQLIRTTTTSIIAFLQNGDNILINHPNVSSSIINLIPNIDNQIEHNTQLLQNRTLLVNELRELNVKEFLFSNKTTILQYYDDYKFKVWINTCQSQLNTRLISIKIGDIMENQAVSLQQQEFVTHLQSFNSELASRVSLSKTRTSEGSTYQKCALDGINDSINTVLSEGEQKIVALSNFLAECTIDGRLNSIIFDDPVTSLDMDYRELIATKIVQLSQNRQIVVLTHDLSFLRLLIDTHKAIITTDCTIIGIDKYSGISGIVTDEIPYLAKNVQERINSIRRILREHDSLVLTDAHGRETKLDSARKRFRMLLERTVEEILSNKTYERFSKNIHFKKGNLSSYIVTEQSDIDFLLNLFGKYSITEHDGGTSTIPQQPSKTEIDQDITDYSNWKNTFRSKLRNFQATYN